MRKNAPILFLTFLGINTGRVRIDGHKTNDQADQTKQIPLPHLPLALHLLCGLPLCTDVWSDRSLQELQHRTGHLEQSLGLFPPLRGKSFASRC